MCPPGRGKIDDRQKASGNSSADDGTGDSRDKPDPQHPGIAGSGFTASENPSVPGPAPYGQRCRADRRRNQSGTGGNLAGAQRSLVSGRTSRIQKDGSGGVAPADRKRMRHHLPSGGKLYFPL